MAGARQCRRHRLGPITKIEENVIARDLTANRLLGAAAAPGRGLLVVVALACAALVAYLATTQLGRSHHQPPPARGSAFYVVDSDIVTPAGDVFRPVGANEGVAGSFDWRGQALGHSADALAWGWNTVRLNVTCTNRATYSVRYKDGYQALMDSVTKVVAEYTAKKIVVIIACHDPYGAIFAGAHKDQVRLSTESASVTTKNRSDAGKTYRQQVEGFWADIAERYKSNSYVWFNFWNEPYGNDNADFVTMNTHFYDLVRSQGAENIVIDDAMNAGNDAAASGAKHIYDTAMGPALDKGKCNVVFSLHAYGWGNSAASYQRLFDAMAKEKLALIVGEFGYKISAPATDATRKAATEMFDLAPPAGVGLLAWNATFGDGFTLKQSGHAFYDDGGDGKGLSPLGSQLWSLGHAPTQQKVFTGNLRDSRCASAQ